MLSLGIHLNFAFSGFLGYSGTVSVTMPTPWTGPTENFAINRIDQAEPTYDVIDEENTTILNNVLMTDRVGVGHFRCLVAISTTAVCGENWRLVARGTISGLDTFISIPFRVIDKGQALAEMAKLITLSELKTDMNISNTNNDATLESLILPASEAIEKHCFQKFHQASAVWMFDGCGQARMFIDADGPLLTALSLEFRYGNSATWTAVDAENYTASDYFITRIDGEVFTEGYANWRLTYTYGYSLVPAQVKKAVCELIKHWTAYSQRVGVMSDVMGGGLKVNYAAITDELPNSVKQLLINYRRLG
jgi:hypothetical protein